MHIGGRKWNPFKMWSNGEKSINVPFNHNRFVCVDYPGVVKNVDKALKSIGGTENVAKV